MQHNHIMVDIETLGNQPGSLILSIAAMEFSFDPQKKGDSFYVKIDVEDAQRHGLKINADTVLWWMKQSEEARQEVINQSNAVPLVDALARFESFANRGRTTNPYLWAKSPRFDLGILGDAYRKIGRIIPWSFRNERDVRTLLHLEPGVKGMGKRSDHIAHHALDDCDVQINELWMVQDSVNASIWEVD